MIPDRLRMARLNFNAESLSDMLRGYVTGLRAGSSARRARSTTSW